jgi:hypothetical protein
MPQPPSIRHLLRRDWPARLLIFAVLFTGLVAGTVR